MITKKIQRILRREWMIRSYSRVWIQMPSTAKWPALLSAMVNILHHRLNSAHKIGKISNRLQIKNFNIHSSRKRKDSRTKRALRWIFLHPNNLNMTLKKIFRSTAMRWKTFKLPAVITQDLFRAMRQKSWTQMTGPQVFANRSRSHSII